MIKRLPTYKKDIGITKAIIEDLDIISLRKDNKRAEFVLSSIYGKK